jgi:hypothetical protein
MDIFWVAISKDQFVTTVCCSLMLLSRTFNVHKLTFVKLFPVDYIVVGSDSGRIVVLEYIPYKNVFERVILIDSFENFIIHSRKIIIIV